MTAPDIPAAVLADALHQVLAVADCASEGAEAFEATHPGVLRTQAMSLRLAAAIITSATGVQANGVS